jgi:hypothetical protein
MTEKEEQMLMLRVAALEQMVVVLVAYSLGQATIQELEDISEGMYEVVKDNLGGYQKEHLYALKILKDGVPLHSV